MDCTELKQSRKRTVRLLGASVTKTAGPPFDSPSLHSAFAQGRLSTPLRSGGMTVLVRFDFEG